jgi:hypothetical protein
MLLISTVLALTTKVLLVKNRKAHTIAAAKNVIA